MPGRALRRLFGRGKNEPAVEEEEPQPRRPQIDRIADVRDRACVRVRGRIDALEVREHGKSPWLEARLRDGSGALVIVWMGRREIPGVHVGREVVVSGRVSSAKGTPRIFNPHYELVAE